MWWVIGGIAVLLVIVMFSHIQMTFFLTRKGKNDFFQYKVKALLGIIRYKVNVPVVIFKGIREGIEYKTDAGVDNLDQHENRSIEQLDKSKVAAYSNQVQELSHHVHHFSTWLNRTLSHIKCDILKWKTEVGVNDCAVTAVITGMIWGLKSTLIGFVSSKISLQTKPVLAVIPQYNKTNFGMDLFLTLRIRHYHALWAILSLFYRIIKVKGGLHVWGRQVVKSLQIRKRKKNRSS